MSIGKSSVRVLAVLTAALCLVMGALPAAYAQRAEPDKIRIYTDTYRPYVRPEGDGDGSAMRLVRLVVRNMGMEPDFDYIDYGYGFYATRRSERALSFPWLKTAGREEQVLFSKPIYASHIQFFYNIRFYPDGMDKDGLADKTFGRVINYSYGEDIDAMLDKAKADGRAKTYVSDVEAITGLLSGEVDVLPQLSAVLMATLEASFANQSRLIRPVPEIKSLFPNYVIAPKTRQGQALITAFNDSYADLLDAGVIDPDALESPVSANVPNDIGEIVASEGFPVIIGRSRSEAQENYAIPPGTRVLILDWSERILAPSDADQLYKTMVDETLVLILNGPHIGKELRIKNMHITIAQ